MTRIIALLVLGPLAWQSSLGQSGTVTGNVTDAEGSAIPGAHVVLIELGRGTATSVGGAFHIENVPAGRHVIEISAVGFERRQLEVEVGQGMIVELNVVLEERLVESDEVVVTAVRRPQATALVPVSVSLATHADLVARNVRSLDEALRFIPGVQMAENQVTIRGSSGFSYNVGSRVLLLVDGMPLLGPETGGVPFEALPMPQVARIEVVKGPGSALYGSGALGGVINVITREFPDRPETSVSLYGGVHDPVRHETWREKWNEASDYRPVVGLSATHARKFGADAGGWLHVSYRKDEGYLRLAADEVFQAYAKLGWDPGSRFSFRLFGGLTARERDAFLYWGGIDDVLNPGNLDLLSPGSDGATGTNDNRSIQGSILPSVRHQISPRVFQTFRLRYFLVQIRPIDEFGRSRPLEAGTSGFRFGGEWQIDWAPSQADYFAAGISADANAARSDFFRSGTGGYVFAQPEFGSFAQYERQMTERFNVLVGLRLDAYQVDTTTTASRLSPKLNASYSVSDDIVLRASFGRGFRVPGIAERYIDNQDFFPFFPNHTLRPELSTGYELGVRVQEASIATIGYSFDAAAFWTDYDGLVEPRFVTDPQSTGSLQPGFQFVNLTRARILGAELTANLTFWSRISGMLGYTYLHARDLTDDLPLAFRSRHLLKTTLDYDTGLGIRIGIDYRLASKPERVDTDFARFVPDADMMVPTHVVDGRLAYTIGPLTTDLLVTNLLDYYYVERPAYLAPPRQVMVRLRLDF